MIRNKRVLPALAALIFTVSMGFTGCDPDDAPPEEPIFASEPDMPAAPPEDSMGSNFSPETVYFAFDDYTLSSEAQSSLSAMADFLRSEGSAVAQIEGHCDERGSIEYNLALGERRAQSVKNYLVQMGIDPARLPTISYGEEKPADSGSSESSWSQNRRAEFVISTP